jgi:hypothetical protein
MPDIIKDGTGRAFLAKVNSENQLVVKSVVTSNIHYRSTLGDSYIIPMYYAQQSAGVDAYAGYMIYTGVRTLVLSEMNVSSQETGLTQVSIYGGSTMAGGIAVPGGGINLNTTSSKTLPATVMHQAYGYGIFTSVVDGAMLMQLNIIGGGMYTLDAKDSLILRPGLPFACKVKCASAGSIVAFYTTGYEMDL